MNVSYLIAASMLAANLASTSTAGATESNPLHPSYFWDKVQVKAVQPNTDVAIAAPITNPLHPGYFAAKLWTAPFVATGVSQNDRYVDDRNPVHPSYHR